MRDSNPTFSCCLARVAIPCQVVIRLFVERQLGARPLGERQFGEGLFRRWARFED